VEILRAVTVNIWNRQGPWAERLPLLRVGLAALAPDVVGMQEVMAFGGSSQADEIAAGLGWHVHYGPAWTIGGGLTWGNALLSPHPFVATDTLPIPAPPELDSRSVAYAVLDAPCGHVPVFCTHLTHQLHRSDARCQQVRALTDHVAERCPVEAFPPILLGDFNADPDSDEMRFLRGLTPLGGKSVYFADAWVATHPLEPGWSYDRKNPYALRSHEPSRRIDYVYARGPDRSFRGEPLDARLVLDQPTGDVWPTDHFGVLAEIQASPRPHAPY
jgi:endonuclease/exonuclease/phosphatase family metal-dependent hydrolase